MSLKTLVNDSTFSTRNLFGMRRDEVVESIEWDQILTHRLEVEPVFDRRGNAIPDRQNIVNEEGESLSIMQGRFTLTQPTDFRDMVREALVGVDHKVTFAATYNGQRSHMVGVEFAGLSNFSVGDEDRHSYTQIFRGSADGTWSLGAGGLLERFFCANQFAATFKDAEGKAKNTIGGQAKFASILSQLEAIEANVESYKIACERLANIEATEWQARQFIAGLLAPSDKALSTRSLNIIEDTTQRFTHGMGNHGATRYDIFNALTERFTHEAGKPASRVGESIAGRAANVKREAYRLITDGQRFQATSERGASILLLAN